MTTVYIGLGSNLGHREGNLRGALQRLGSAGATVTRVSSLWLSAPVPEGQPPYLNAAAELDSTLSAAEFLRTLKCVERALGRRAGPRWGARPIDLDILIYGSQRLATAQLTVPHPRMFDRSFVLAPLLEILDPAHELRLRVLRRIREVGLDGVRRAGVIDRVRVQSSG